VLAILDGSNTVKEFYTHGPDLSGTVGGAGGIGGILSCRIGATNYWLHSDAMGHVILATDQQGKEVGQYRYSPFGRALNKTGDFASRLQYSSKELDPETGLINFGYRHLNPQIGRWMERDRIGEEDGPNLYRFVQNATISLIDTEGLKSSEYDYSVYLGIGPARGNEIIQRAAQIAASYKADYREPKNASKKCRFTIEDVISSGDLRNATTEHDDVHFYGHGVRFGTRNPDWKRGDPADQLWTYRTAIAFRDGDKFLSDVLTIAPGKVKARYVTTWVCHDKFVDPNNPSNIEVCKPINSADANLSIMLFRTMKEIITKCQQKKCCAPLD
jgi:RHS repeat-associated protein